jgi:hypothetical protein
MVRRNVTRQKNRLDVFIPCLAFPREKRTKLFLGWWSFQKEFFYRMFCSFPLITGALHSIYNVYLLWLLIHMRTSKLRTNKHKNELNKNNRNTFWKMNYLFRSRREILSLSVRVRNAGGWKLLKAKCNLENQM